MDPAGKITYFKYDPVDRLTDVIRKVGDGDDVCDGDDSCTRFLHDPAGNVTAMFGPEGLRTDYGYDAADRLIEESVPNPDGGFLTTSFQRDGADHVTTTGLPNGNRVIRTFDRAGRLLTASDTAAGALAAYQYDANGNVTVRTDGAGHSWRFDYDSLNRVTAAYDPLTESPTDLFTAYRYDPAGNLLRTIRANGVQTKREYDRVNQLLRTIEDFCTNGCTAATANTTTHYAYDGAGRLASMTDHDGHATGYVYDGADRVTETRYPDAGSSGIHIVHFSYDVANNRVTRTDQNGVAAESVYDDLHRLQTRTYRREGATLLAEAFTYDRAGRMLSAGNGFANLGFGYDVLGRLVSSTQTQRGQTFPVGYDYVDNTNGQPSTRTVTYPGGRQVVDTIDLRGRLQGVSGGSGVGATWQYDLANLVTGAALGNGVTTAFDHDVDDRLTGIEHAKDATALFHVDYGYNAVGNRLWTDNILRPTRSEKYSYDNRDRLQVFKRGVLNETKTDVPTPLVHPVAPGVQRWMTTTSPIGELDARGNWLVNRLKVNGQLRPIETRTPNERNEYTVIDPDGPDYPIPPVPLDYDTNGNVTTDGTAPNAGAGIADGQRYEYDAANRLVKVWRTNGTAGEGDDAPLLAIRYDALGRRVESTEYIDPATAGAPELATPVKTWHVYAGQEPVEEYAVTTNGLGGLTTALAREFVHGSEAAGFPHPVAMIDHTSAGSSPPETPEILHFLHDVLGSVVALADTNGAVVERYEYDPYGPTYVTTPDYSTHRLYSTFGNPFLWTGQRYDPTTRLYHFWARSYSPRLGRWLQPDPLGYVDGSNLFEYGVSGPLQSVDPLGLMPFGAMEEMAIYSTDRSREVQAELGIGIGLGAYRAVKGLVVGLVNLGRMQNDPIYAAQVMSGLATQAADTYTNFRNDGSSVAGAACRTAAAGGVSALGGGGILNVIDGTDADGNPLSIREFAATGTETGINLLGTAVTAAEVVSAVRTAAAVAAEASATTGKTAAATGEAATKGTVAWMDEAASMSPEARAYDAGALGARSSVATGQRQVPVLDVDGNPVKFDGFDGAVLIDRKRAVTFFPKAKDQALRQSQALRQNGYRGLWEVPSQSEKRRALRLFDELGIDNIDVEVVP